MKLNKKQKQEIENYLNNNTSFNMFGICNISSIKCALSFKITDLKLKNYIKKTFSKEFTDLGIEFR